MKLLLSAAVFALLLTPVAEPQRTGEPARQAADYASVAGLPPLSSNPAQPSVRVWRRIALTDSITAWVVTRDSISVYSGSDSRKLRLISSITTRRAQKVLKAFQRLRAYDGQWIFCSRVKDGWGLVIEGADASGHFAFTSSTPNLCAEYETKRIHRAYELLTDIAGDGQ